MHRRHAKTFAVGTARRFISRGAAALLLSLVCVCPALAQSAPPTAAPSPVTAPPPSTTAGPGGGLQASLDATQQALTEIQNQAQTASNDNRLAALAAQAAAVEARAEAVVGARDHDVAQVDQSLKGLSKHGGRRISASARSQLAALTTRRSGLEAELQRARGVAGAASATFNFIAERRREGFSVRLLERSASPLSPGFWMSLVSAVDTDSLRLVAAVNDAASVARQAPEPKGLVGLGVGFVLAMALAFPCRRRLEKLGRRKSGEAVHPGVARTGAAVWVAAVDTGMPACAAASLHLGAQWGGLLSDKADALADAAVIATIWAAAVLALGRVLVTDADPTQRLLPMPDHAAKKVEAPLAAIALVTGLGFLLTRLNFVVGASVAATIAANCVLSLAYAAVAGLVLVSFGRSRASPDAAVANAPLWTLISLLLTTAIAVTLAAVVAGYTTLAALVSGQVFWLSIIAAVTYLLLRFVDDLCGVLFGRRGAAARTLSVLFGLRGATISQIGLLLSAGVQLIISIGAISLALTPFGQSGDLLLAHFSKFGGGIRLGSATVSPAAMAAGFATLALGMGVVHLVQRWVNRRYLPLTDWDAGLRNSVSTGVGYLGVGIAVICALAAMGFGFRQIALIASALSVGIGFGLQQVVQNFVSGVILLVERPVKVGDWVKLDTVEGDIRRIRVRATEIQTFDRSTVIVPNSDLITKSVQNKTLGDPRGRIQLQLSIANPADAEKARDLILEVAKQHPGVLQDPAPVVYIDSLAGGGAVNFNCYLYVEEPRQIYRTRSDLYFDLLSAFPRNDIAFVGAAGPQNVVVEAGDQLEKLLRGRLAETNGAGPSAPAASH